MSHEFKIYCGGKFITTNDSVSVFNSFDNSLVGTTFLANATHLEEAIEAANQAAPGLKHMPSHVKTRILNEIASQLALQKKEISSILAAEANKPLKWAMAEVDRSVQTFKVAAEEAGRTQAEYITIDRTAAGEHKEGLVKLFPIGLVSGISPFNFPLNLAVHKIAPAIAAGCPIILKPATSTPLTTLMLAQIIDNTELPKGALSIMPMNRENGNLLVTDERFKLLTFTGSPAVGWKMKADAGKKRVVLELGGNAAVIVTPSASIDWAVKRSVLGAFAYSGQVCIHTQRIFVQGNCYQEFIDKFIAETNTLRSGSPLDITTDISGVIDENNAKRIERWIAEAVNNGATLLAGGKRTGTYIEPTILTNTKPEMKVCAQEVFGPVVVIEPYQNFKEAVAMVNNTNYGLQAGVFTNLLSEMNYAYAEIECGGVIINDSSIFRVDHMPYGGIKDSGTGREGVKYAIADMCEPKLLIKNLN
jgi:acyl-CoA reductase-like NAD-dependent aldehyde dehydrogenase